MRPRFYWISDRLHEVGEVIEPGNWGRLVLSTPNHDWLKMEQQALISGQELASRASLSVRSGFEKRPISST